MTTSTVARQNIIRPAHTHPAMELVMKMRSARRKTTTLILLLTVILIASREEANMMVAAETGDPCVENKDASPETRCFVSCFKPGKCNECCKNLGFVRGKCSNLACYCCTTPEEKPTIT